MCFFFCCTPCHKPTPYFKGACNQFGFGHILKSKDQLLISDNSDGSRTLVFSSKIIKKWLKILFLAIFIENPTWWKIFKRFVFSAQNAFANTWSHLICKTHVRLCRESPKNYEMIWTKTNDGHVLFNLRGGFNNWYVWWHQSHSSYRI